MQRFEFRKYVAPILFLISACSAGVRLQGPRVCDHTSKRFMVSKASSRQAIFEVRPGLASWPAAHPHPKSASPGRTSKIAFPHSNVRCLNELELIRKYRCALNSRIRVAREQAEALDGSLPVK